MAELTFSLIPQQQLTNAVIVAFHGECDHATLPPVEQKILDLVQNFQGRHLIFDFTKLRYINSEGVGFLVSLSVKLKKRGTELLLCSFQSNVGDILQLVGIPKMIRVFQTLEEAIQAVQTSL